jgi:hypothetical protein
VVRVSRPARVDPLTVVLRVALLLAWWEGAYVPLKQREGGESNGVCEYNPSVQLAVNCWRELFALAYVRNMRGGMEAYVPHTDAVACAATAMLLPVGSKQAKGTLLLLGHPSACQGTLYTLGTSIGCQGTFYTRGRAVWRRRVSGAMRATDTAPAVHSRP